MSYLCWLVLILTCSFDFCTSRWFDCRSCHFVVVLAIRCLFPAFLLIVYVVVLVDEFVRDVLL